MLSVAYTVNTIDMHAAAHKKSTVETAKVGILLESYNSRRNLLRQLLCNFI